MAKIRCVKPEIFTSSQLAECCCEARWLFVGLMCFSDDSGIHPDDPRRIKLEVFPGDDCSKSKVASWVNELVCVGVVERYSSNGSGWLRITGWARHQRIDQPTYRHPLPDGTIPETGLRRWQKKNPDLMGSASATHQNGNTPDIQRTYDVHTEGDWIGTDGTGMDGFVRPFVATDHFDLWPEARRRAAETAKKLWPSGRPKPNTEPEQTQHEADNTMLLRFAFLGCAFFGDGWLADGIAGTIAKHPKPVKNQLAYLKSILRKSAENQGYVLNDLLDSIKISKKSKEPSSGVPSNP